MPDHLFLHFVLPYRVNTENIEDSRGILYSELAERTAHLSMEDAILETNYWCHEKANYIGSDLRTISPLTMIRNARGGVVRNRHLLLQRFGALAFLLAKCIPRAGRIVTITMLG